MTSSGSISRIRAFDESHSRKGLPSGSVGNTLTLDVILGSTWSPEIRHLSAGQYKQMCSGACPLPTTTCQYRLLIFRVCPSIRRRYESGRGYTTLPKPPKRSV